jgi:hypothetical protein
MVTEINLFKRRIVEVVSYFDEDCELPWDYVQRTGDGRFEAIATLLVTSADGTPDHCSLHSVGIFAEVADAVKALRRQGDMAEVLGYPGGIGVSFVSFVELGTDKTPPSLTDIRGRPREVNAGFVRVPEVLNRSVKTAWPTLMPAWARRAMGRHEHGAGGRGNGYAAGTIFVRIDDLIMMRCDNAAPYALSGCSNH